MITDPKDRKNLLERRIAKEVLDYYSQFHIPLPFRILAAKYGKSAREFGDFAGLIDGLSHRKFIRVSYTKSGARQIFPYLK